MKFIVIASFFIFIFTIATSLSIMKNNESKEDQMAALTGNFDDGE